jgi:hypothetical protein
MSHPSMPLTDNASRATPLPVLPPRGLGETSRKDLWWVVPLLTFLGLTTFIVYSTWAAFQGEHYAHGPYLSPFYSPLLFGSEDGHKGWFGPKPQWWPAFLPFSAAFFILWVPAGFRFTCYYYRGAYYKAFWADPPSCSVGEPRKSYWGEQTLPLIIQNFHRYFFYLALLLLFALVWDVILAMSWPVPGDPTKHEFGIGVGTILLLVNVTLLYGYTLGCHSFRHLIGGWRDEVSKSAAFGAYKCVGCLNRRHMLLAWMSLFTVGFSDVYIRLCSMGIWHDWRII